MNIKMRSILILSLLLILVACQPEIITQAVEVAPSMAYGTGYDAAYNEDEAGFYAEEAMMDGEMDTVANQAPPSAPDIPEAQERLIIRTAQVEASVEDVDATIEAITAMVESNGGWVVDSNTYQYGENNKNGEISVRIPSEGYNSALEAIRELAVEVTRESSSGQDVTEEYVDLSSRLGNLEATAERVRTFLDEADNVEEALAVNQELSRLEGELERIKGRMQYLSQSASFSTISVNLRTHSLSQPISTSWEPSGIAREAIDALVDTLQGIGALFIWLGIYVLPLAIIPVAVIWWGIRRYRSRRQPFGQVTPTPD